MKTIIKLIKNDITNGRRQSERFSPIALALKRFGFKDVRVTKERIRATYCDMDIWAELPRKAQAFIDRFDVAKPVKPFTFTLDI